MQFSLSNRIGAIKTHLNEQLGYEGLVQFSSLELPQLETFLTISLREFNQNTATDAGAGFCQYAASLILVEYFCFGDSNQLRPYLAAILTGVDPDEAAERHLLRSRSPEAIEDLLQERWKQAGLTLRFLNDPSVGIENLKRGLGAGPSQLRPN